VTSFNRLLLVSVASAALRECTLTPFGGANEVAPEPNLGLQPTAGGAILSRRG
jgi:hypothetical protein